MWRVIFSTYKKNRIGIIRAVPWSFMVSRIVTGITQIVFPYFIYYYFMNGNMNKEFGAYAEGADYMTYVVLGSALNVLAVSVLMNIGRALITELREGTLEVLLLSPAPRKNYFVGCLLEQTTRALIEFGTVLVIGALLGANLRYFFSFQTIIVVLLAVLSFFCMGITLSSVMLYTRDTYLTQNELKRSDGDNPTIGIVLCADTDDDIARYSVMHGNEQLFASKYKLYLPTEEELKAEIETQKAMFYLQQKESKEEETEE